MNQLLYRQHLILFPEKNCWHFVLFKQFCCFIFDNKMPKPSIASCSFVQNNFALPRSLNKMHFHKKMMKLAFYRTKKERLLQFKRKKRYWSRRLACATCGGVRKCSWPLLTHTFFFFSPPPLLSIAFHPLWGVQES